MTMPNAAHPDPERLAALAGDDADAKADRGLTEHVTSCDACGAQVRDMAALRVALAELPDLTPSRPLQLLPPVAAPALSGWRVTFRRAFAPVAVAGMALLIVGGVGAAGALGPADARQFLIFSAAQPAAAPQDGEPEITTDDGGESDFGSETDGGQRPAPDNPTASAVPGGVGAVAPTPEPPGEAAGEGGGDEDPATPRSENLDAESTTSGWVVVAGLGLGLLVLAVALRALAAKRVRL
jgi:hypothetical protein